jgi:hypothetical protein
MLDSILQKCLWMSIIQNLVHYDQLVSLYLSQNQISKSWIFLAFSPSQFPRIIGHIRPSLDISDWDHFWRNFAKSDCAEYIRFGLDISDGSGSGVLKGAPAPLQSHLSFSSPSQHRQPKGDSWWPRLPSGDSWSFLGILLPPPLQINSFLYGFLPLLHPQGVSLGFPLHLSSSFHIFNASDSFGRIASYTP